jgi:antitoxin ParD1/3/4
MVNRTYSITETLDRYIKDRVGTGEYVSDSEYLRELIRRDQDENKEIADIRAKLVNAEQSGFTDKSRLEQADKYYNALFERFEELSENPFLYQAVLQHPRGISKEPLWY